MDITKVSLAGLIGISLCMANISGIVMDTGKVPIAGAIVQLEKGGQTATTGVDGSFTIVLTTGILPEKDKFLFNNISAMITGNVLKVKLVERSEIVISAFDLNGKLISSMCKTFNAGSHSITPSDFGSGIHLYKVKIRDSEFVLKHNAAGGVSFGSLLNYQSTSSNSRIERSKAMTAINDIITVTKTGYLNYQCVQYNSDTMGIEIKMIASAGTVMDWDGNVYQTVRIGNQEWTVENLRTTKYNDGLPIQKVTNNSEWYNIWWRSYTTPAYCYYNNTTNADSIKKFGALYNGFVVDTKKLAPEGWHVPSDAEWDTLQNYLIAKGYNWDGTTAGNKGAKSLAAKTDWNTDSTTGTIGCGLSKNNNSGFSALPSGYRHYANKFEGQGCIISFWSATNKSSMSAWCRTLYSDHVDLYRSESSFWSGFSVRLVRD
ncbi:MAG: FISUMP domain-containing protein [Fibrobacterota bacterium]